MSTVSFKNTDLKLSVAIDADTIETVGKGYVTLTSHPDIKISIAADQIKSLGLLPGTKVSVTPVTDTFMLQVVEPKSVPASTASRKPSSGATSHHPRSNILDY